MKNFYIIFGAFLVLIGLGMMFRLAFVYSMMAMFCGIQVILGIVDIIAPVLTVDSVGLRVGMIVGGVIQMISGGLMFYFAEETALTSMAA